MTAQMKIATFLYHDVSDDPSESGFQRRSAMAYKQTRRVFASQLDQIARTELTPELVSDINFWQAGKHLLLTFDDGGRGALNAADELDRHGWKGHFFIITSFLSSRTFLDVRGMRYLHSCGHLIGSHSHTHPDIFSMLSFEQMVEEWRVSCDLIANLLGVRCIAGSVPGGDISPDVFQSADAAGMQFLFTSDPFLIPKQKGACWVLGRVCPRARTPLASVQRLAEFQGWTREQLRWRAKAALKIGFSPLYRVYARHVLQ